MSANARVTVVVLSRDRGAELSETLRRLTALPERPPIIVVDNGSTDGSPARVAAEHPGIRLIALGENLGAAARNLGARAAATPYVAFADDDSWWEPGALAQAGDLLDAHPGAGLLAARVLLGNDGRLEPTCAAMASSPLTPGRSLPGPRILGFVACGAVVRRSAFLAAGGFHARFGVGGEEGLLATDMAANGFDLVYVDELVAQHRPSSRRDRRGRRAIQTRNDLWLIWLRRPPRIAAAASVRALRDAARERPAALGVAHAVAGLPWVLRERRVVSPGLEAELARLHAVA